MRRRPSARVLVLDTAERVLLFRFVHTQGALAGWDYRRNPERSESWYNDAHSAKGWKKVNEEVCL